MSEYHPYLLPLLLPDHDLECCESIASALDEEAALTRLLAPDKPDWVSISQHVRCSYGIPLMFEDDGLSHTKILELPNHSGKCSKVLCGKLNGRKLFILQHPDDVSLYDIHAQEDQDLILAKPSLFAILAGKQIFHSGQTAGAGQPNADHEHLAAFHDYMIRLVSGNHPSDWHLEPGPDGYRSRLRIHGNLNDPTHITRRKGDWIIQSIIGQCGFPGRQKDQLLEGGFSFKERRQTTVQARVSLVPSRYGYAMVIRFLFPECTTSRLTELGLSSRDSQWLHKAFTKREGLWLIVGPTGSGKSTTLQSILQWCVGYREKVLTIEDPVERLLPGVQQVQVDRHQGLDFACAVKAFLRQAPDTILIGEIRDVETAGIAMQSARTGHRVLSTVHARDTRGVIRRFKDLEQDQRDLTSVCEVLIHQRLLPLLCEDCRFLHQAESEICKLAESLSLEVPERLALAMNCGRCLSGYIRRTGIFSVGTIQDQYDSDFILLKAAWLHLIEQRTDFRALLPYLTSRARREFTLCQV